MESMGVISKVEEPVLWCAGMVLVPKRNSVLREVFPLPEADDTVAQLHGAKVFTKLDANSGFWQIPLAEESCLLTTFVTPFGRYCFNKLPFGISSAPEHFQKRMSHILSGLEGVICLVDDVLVFGRDKEEHDSRLMASLELLGSCSMEISVFGKNKLIFRSVLMEMGFMQIQQKLMQLKV